MMPLENLNCPYYHELKYSQKYDRFYEVTWKLALPLLSQGHIFTKIKQLCWSELKIWATLIITSSNVHKNTPHLMKLLEYLNCPYYHEGNFFAKIRQFCWSDLKIWTAPITPSWNFCGSKEVLLKRFENLNCADYGGLIFSLKWRSFADITWKFELPLLSRAESFAKISHI